MSRVERRVKSRLGVVRGPFRDGDGRDGDWRDGELLIQLEANEDVVCILDEDAPDFAGILRDLESMEDVRRGAN